MSANNTMQYPGLSLSFLNSSKEEYSKVNDENFYSTAGAAEKDNGRKLLMVDRKEKFLKEKLTLSSW